MDALGTYKRTSFTSEVGWVRRGSGLTKTALQTRATLFSNVGLI